jgi:drug/metabolite transporter, DME family
MPGATAWVALAALVLLPTIGGFYFTTKAVQLGEASKVQIIETSDPVFATLIGFLPFGDTLSAPGLCGGALILAGLLLAIRRQSVRASASNTSAVSGD